MKPRLALLLSSALVSGSALAQPSVEYVQFGYLITDLSQDGSAASGNSVADGLYETFRWTSIDGVERLGRGTVAVLGKGAGGPEISRDGTRVSATILSSDTRMTAGVWDINTGWSECFPPMPSNGIVLDEEYGASWGISGDGQTVAGLYWKTSPIGAQPFAWSASGGTLPLPITGRSGRANTASYDGGVVVGWQENSWGGWEPQAWRAGVRYPLTDEDVGSQAHGVNHDGSVLVGTAYDDAQASRAATVWRWNGASYDITRLPNVPDVIPTQGQSYLLDVTDDGTRAVGSAIFGMSPGGPRTGIIWIQGRGVLTIQEWVDELGIASDFPPSWEFVELTSISPDGSAVAGVAINTDTFQYAGFVIRFCRGDVNRSGVVDLDDFFAFLGAFDQSGMSADIDGVYGVTLDDFFAFLNSFDSGC